ncbi:protein TolQ [Alphaproteobacteria bacterium]|nr:protein TolQ [Alphaproteobacteria bacterium]
MEQQAVEAAAIAGSVAGDLSIWSLIVRADLIVKLVLLLLLSASVWSWAIIFDKIRKIRKITNKTETFEDQFWSGGSLEELYDKLNNKADHPIAILFTSAMKEWRRTNRSNREGQLSTSLRDRIGQVMRLTITREVENLERYLGFLATVGSTAPFVGLFGTVWGIMNSFQSIAASENTTLTVVAPGIAEALFATAMGLVAAIPAVVAYNKFSNDLSRFANRLEGFSSEFSAIMTRQLEER